MEPPLDQLITQFKGVSVGGFEYNCFDDRIIDDLTSCLSALSSPDDLYNFFEKLRGERMKTLFTIIFMFSFNESDILVRSSFEYFDPLMAFLVTGTLFF